MIDKNIKNIVSKHESYPKKKEDVSMVDLIEYINKETKFFDSKPQGGDLYMEVEEIDKDEISYRSNNTNKNKYFKIEIKGIIEDNVKRSDKNIILYAKREGEDPYSWHFRAKKW